MKRACILAALFILLSVKARADDTAIVAEVLDSGTLRVEYNDREETLRLIGIDVPERGSGDETDGGTQNAEKDEQSRQAALDYARNLVLPGYKIRLEFDFEQRDRHDRLLAYAYLPDNTMLNYVLIYQGYAVPRIEPPNVKYSGPFKRAYQDALDHGRGLWKQ